MLMHHGTGSNLTNPYATPTAMPQSVSSLLSSSALQQGAAAFPQDSQVVRPSLNFDPKLLDVFKKPKTQTVVVEKEADTPWLLILAVAAIAYYMGKKK